MVLSDRDIRTAIASGRIGIEPFDDSCVQPASVIDPAWDGHITLELSNVNTLPITLYPGMRIGQLSFFPLSSAAERPYGSPELGSSYQGQTGPTPSRYKLDMPR